MNLLEHYIKKVISIKEFKIDEIWAKGIDFVKVKIYDASSATLLGEEVE